MRAADRRPMRTMSSRFARLFEPAGIEAWSSPRRRQVLGRMPKRSVCAEIGVWRGDFSATILHQVKPKRLHLIDPWRFVDSGSHAQSWYGGRIAKDQADMDAMHTRVRRRFAAPIEDGTVVIDRRDSAEAASDLPEGYFDWVYVDGDHAYEGIRRDLRLYRPLVKAGGFICGDDYRDDEWWGDGVIRAVDELVESEAVHVVLLDHAQFILQVH